MERISLFPRERFSVEGKVSIEWRMGEDISFPWEKISLFPWEIFLYRKSPHVKRHMAGHAVERTVVERNVSGERKISPLSMRLSKKEVTVEDTAVVENILNEEKYASQFCTPFYVGTGSFLLYGQVPVMMARSTLIAAIPLPDMEDFHFLGDDKTFSDFGENRPFDFVWYYMNGLFDVMHERIWEAMSVLEKFRVWYYIMYFNIPTGKGKSLMVDAYITRIGELVPTTEDERNQVRLGIRDIIRTLSVDVMPSAPGTVDKYIPGFAKAYLTGVLTSLTTVDDIILDRKEISYDDVTVGDIMIVDDDQALDIRSKSRDGIVDNLGRTWTYSRGVWRLSGGEPASVRFFR